MAILFRLRATVSQFATILGALYFRDRYAKVDKDRLTEKYIDYIGKEMNIDLRSLEGKNFSMKMLKKYPDRSLVGSRNI
jgi:hypothetical protein